MVKPPIARKVQEDACHPRCPYHLEPKIELDMDLRPEGAIGTLLRIVRVLPFMGQLGASGVVVPAMPPVTSPEDFYINIARIRCKVRRRIRPKRKRRETVLKARMEAERRGA